MHVIFSSFGNDSIALLEWARHNGLKDVYVAYSNTGWAANWWHERVSNCADIVQQLGWKFVEIPSEGFKNMVRRKKGFPRQGYQYCTGHLKIEPAMEWLDKIDPDKKCTVLVGVRREESANRRDYPAQLENSNAHGGRKMIAPLVDYTEDQRNELIRNFAFEVLPHRSMECFPCINSNRGDILQLAKDKKRIEEIAEFEKEMGFTGKGKPRTMFRPYRHMGATGIKEVVKWAQSPHGKYNKDQHTFDLDDGTDTPNEGGCLDGWCGI